MTFEDRNEVKPKLPLGGEDLLRNNEGYIVGARGQALLRHTSNAHFITMASTGFGKGRSVVTPNLLSHPGSVFTTEIGGDNVRKTIKYRRHVLGQEVYVLDPLEVTQESRASFNILDTLDPKETTFTNDVELISRSILQDHKGETGRDPYWVNAPMELLKALIIYTKTASDVLDNQRHFPYVAELLSTVGTKEWKNLLLRMSADRSEHKTTLNQIGNRFSIENDNTRSVLSVVESYLGFARNPQLTKYMKTSDFKLKDLRDKKCTVYLVMPSAEYYKSNATWLRLIIERAIASCPDLGDDKVTISHNERILFIMDEFTQLGKLEAIDQGMQTARHKGITLWCVFQDLNRLCSVYGEEISESFLGASGCIQIFGTTDLKTSKYVSERMGKSVTLIPSVSESVNWSDGTTQNHSETTSVGESLSWSQGTTTGTSETWSTNLSSGYSHGITDSSGKTSSSSTTNTDSFSTTDTDSASTTDTDSISTTDTDSISTTNTNFSSTAKGKSSSKTDGDLKTETTKTTGHSKSVSDGHSKSVSDGHSKGTTIGETSTEATSITKSKTDTESEGQSVGTSQNITEQTGSGINKQRSFQVGWADTKNVGGQYSVTYTPHILPSLEADQVIDLLGDDTKEFQLLFLREGARKILDGRANWDQIEILRQRVEGPPLLPPPQQLMPPGNLLENSWDDMESEWQPEHLEIPDSPKIEGISKNDLELIFNNEFNDLILNINLEKLEFQFNQEHFLDQSKRLEHDINGILNKTHNQLEQFLPSLRKIKNYESKIHDMGRDLKGYVESVESLSSRIHGNSSNINDSIDWAKEYIQHMEKREIELINYREWIQEYAFFKKYWENLEPPIDIRNNYEITSPPNSLEIDVHEKLNEVELNEVIIPNFSGSDSVDNALKSLPPRLSQDKIEHQLRGSLRSAKNNIFKALNDASTFVSEKLELAKQKLADKVKPFDEKLKSIEKNLEDLDSQLLQADQEYQNCLKKYRDSLSFSSKLILCGATLLYSIFALVIFVLVIAIFIALLSVPVFAFVCTGKSLSLFSRSSLLFFSAIFLSFFVITGTWIFSRNATRDVCEGMIYSFLIGGLAVFLALIYRILSASLEITLCMQELSSIFKVSKVQISWVTASLFFLVAMYSLVATIVKLRDLKKSKDEAYQALQNTKDRVLISKAQEIAEREKTEIERIETINSELEELKRELIHDLRRYIFSGFDSWLEIWNSENSRIKNHITLLEKSRQSVFEAGDSFGNRKSQLRNLATQIDLRWDAVASIYDALELKRMHILYEVSSWEIWKELEEKNGNKSEIA